MAKRLIALVTGAVLLLSVPAAAKTTIVFWTEWQEGSPQGDALKALVEKYNAAHPEVQVSRQVVSGMLDKVAVAAAAGEPPDLGYMAIEYAREFSALRVLADPRSAFSPADWKRLTSDFLPGIEMYLDHSTFPYMATTFANLFNADMFEEAGLPVDRPPVTWQDFRTYAKRLTRESPDNPGKKVFGAGIEPWGWGAWAIMFRVRLMAWQWGTDVFNADYSRTNLLDPRFYDAMSFWVEGAQEGWTGTKKASGKLINRNLAMQLTPGDNIGSWERAGIKIHAGPEPKHVGAAAHFGGQGFFLLNTPKSRDAARFLLWAFEPEQHAAALITAQTGMVPTRFSTIRTSSMREFVAQRQNRQVLLQMLETIGRPALPRIALESKEKADRLAQAETVIGEWIVKAVSGELPLRAALEQATTLADAILIGKAPDTKGK